MSTEAISSVKNYGTSVHVLLKPVGADIADRQAYLVDAGAYYQVHARPNSKKYVCMIRTNATIYGGRNDGGLASVDLMPPKTNQHRTGQCRINNRPYELSEIHVQGNIMTGNTVAIADMYFNPTVPDIENFSKQRGALIHRCWLNTHIYETLTKWMGGESNLSNTKYIITFPTEKESEKTIRGLLRNLMWYFSEPEYRVIVSRGYIKRGEIYQFVSVADLLDVSKPLHDVYTGKFALVLDHGPDKGLLTLTRDVITPTDSLLYGDVGRIEFCVPNMLPTDAQAAIGHEIHQDETRGFNLVNP